MNLREEKMNDIFTKYHLDNGTGIVLHRFTGAEGTKADFHDHPYNFTSHILTGGYVEQKVEIETVYDGYYSFDIIERKPGTSHFVLANDIHRINYLISGECWTSIVPETPYRVPHFWRFDKGIIYKRAWNSEIWIDVYNKS